MSDFEWPGDERKEVMPAAPEEHREIKVVGPPGCG